MNIQHFVITRFCCKTYDNGSGKKPRLHPLSYINLETRFRLLEMICLPSLMAQSNQNFTWIILIDPELDNKDQNRLKQIALQQPNTILHQCLPLIDFLSLNWLEQYIEDGTNYVLTSNLDDDDAVPVDFVKHLHKRIFEQEANKVLPVMKAYGFRQIVNWDISPSYLCPFGTLSPWHRKAKVSACGFSFLCKYPEYNINVMGVNHTIAMELLDFSTPDIVGKHALIQQKIKQQLENNDENMVLWEEAQFFDLSRQLGPVIISNHSCNIQETRRMETKSAYKTILSEAAFLDCRVNWRKVEENMPFFKNN